jgi:hypothetical protein
MPGNAAKTGPIPTVRVFRGIQPVATVWVRVQPDLELTREFGTVANTTLYCTARSGLVVGDTATQR